MSNHKIPESKSGWLLKQSRGNSFLKNWRKRSVYLCPQLIATAPSVQPVAYNKNNNTHVLLNRFIILETGKLTYFVGSNVHNSITTGTERKGKPIIFYILTCILKNFIAETNTTFVAQLYIDLIINITI
jgi:hypothetical protein